MRIHFAILTAVALAAVAGAAIATTSAEARDRSGGSSTITMTTNTPKMPMHGYSGSIGIGRNTQYCDYQRIPTHDCSSGRCKVVGWTVKHHCQ